MQKLLKQASAMQAKMQEAQQAAADQEFEGTSGGGMVKAVVKGSGEIVSVTFDPSVLDPEDPEVGRYAGDELDFGAAVLEILTLAWPMQPRCRESCRGLCPNCGTNWNVEPCGCVETSVSRPFAGLKGLLERARRGGG